MSLSGLLDGRSPALLVVDVQEAAVQAGPFEGPRVLRNISTLIDTAREAATPVLFIQHDGRPGEPEEPHTPGWEIHRDVTPLRDEPVFRKRFNSAFRETSLHAHLRARGLETLIVVGIQTEYCVDTTIRVAFELGYSVVVPEMTNTTFDNGPVAARDLYDLFNHRIFAGRFAEVRPLDDVLRALRMPGARRDGFGS